jgi:RimJ/RimL family protein N-acetyltransferase
MKLELDGFIIRDWLPGDEESIAMHANNRKIWRNLRDAFPSPYTLEDANQWIRSATQENPRTSFAIVIDGAAVGGIGLIFKDDIFRRSAEIGYWLSEQFWGRGIATDALKAMTEYAFQHFDLCRIWASVFEWNPASMRVLEKAGYQFEGRLRKAVTKDGQTIDEIVYSRIRTDQT